MNRLQLWLAMAVAPVALMAQTHWIAPWSAAPAPQLATQAEMVSAKMAFNNQTLREIVHISAGGSTLRVRLSQAINYWIRNSGTFDYVADFDFAVRDPARPDSFLAAYDSGDHLHPGDTGYKAMAAAIDLTWFR